MDFHITASAKNRLLHKKTHKNITLLFTDINSKHRGYHSEDYYGYLSIMV